jgi:hypothetical protein
MIAAMGHYSLNYVKREYGVPARRGQRVIHDGREYGTVTSGDGPYVRVRFDGRRHSVPCHPLSLDYLDGIAPEDRLARRNARIDVWNDHLNGRITVEQYRQRVAQTADPTPAS